MNTFVTKINESGIEFDNGFSLTSHHEQDCCEAHYLYFRDLTLDDFEGLVFDLTNDGFFERIPDYGIALLSTNGHPVRIPGYGSNNGYYSSALALVLADDNGHETFYDISDCQVVHD